MIRRSNGVVFVEQLAPILNPRNGPPPPSEISAKFSGGSGGTALSGLGSLNEGEADEPLVVRLLTELNGIPEVRLNVRLVYSVDVVGRTGQEQQIEIMALKCKELRHCCSFEVWCLARSGRL